MLAAGEATPQAKDAPCLLFLDVDGVLNTTTMMTGDACRVHPKLMRRLAKLCHASRCGLVLSSTWRLEEKYYAYLLQQLDKALGVDCSDGTGSVASEMVVGATPSLPLERRLREDGMYGPAPGAVELLRSDEILAWLDSHIHSDNETIPPWAVLDDLNLMGVAEAHRCELAERLRGHVVRTNPEAGFTERNLEDVEKIFGVYSDE